MPTFRGRTVVGKRARGRHARGVVGGLLSLVLLVGLTGCGSSSSSKTVLGGSNQAADITVEKVDGLSVFSPNKVEIKLNTAVSFTVLNKDTVLHNVTIPGFAIDMDVAPGQRVEIKLPAVPAAPRDGFYSFYCKYHQNQGEAGRINVAK